MSFKIQVTDDNFIFNNKNYPIIETFIDFINSFNKTNIEEMKSIIRELIEKRNIDLYYKKLERNNYSIFFYPVLQIPDKIIKQFDSSKPLDNYAENFLYDYIAQLSVANIYGVVETINSFLNPLSQYSNLTIKQKYALFLKSSFWIDGLMITNTYTDIKYKSNINFSNNIDENYKIIKNNPDPEIVTYIVFEDIESMCQYAIVKMLKDNISIKNCKNCGRLFVADNKREYCNRIYKDGLTCYQVGSTKLFKEKKHSDPFLQEYMRAYKRLQNFYYKNSSKITEDLKKKLFQEIRVIYDNSITNNINLEDYKNELSTYNYDNLSKKYL